MKPHWISFIFLISVIVAGCGSSQPAAENIVPQDPQVPQAQEVMTNTPQNAIQLTSTPENTQEMPIMNEVPISTPLDPGMETIVTTAKNDLATRLAIDPGQIELLEAASVTWPDGSLGCPKPGMLYTQVQVDGIRIRFQAGEQVYEYHGGGERPPFLCK